MYGDAGSYQIQRSLRFNSSDSAYLSRTPAVAGNRRTFTWAGWVKRSGIGGDQQLIYAAPSSTDTSHIRFDDDNTLNVFEYTTGFVWQVKTSQVFRDVSSWYHIAVSIDTTQSTSSNRVKIYVNGVQVTAFGTATYPSQNTDTEFNNTVGHAIGRNDQGASNYFSGYLANIHFIDGQALTPSSFTETDATTGQLIPKTYTGSYGTNGFNLLFADNSSNTASTLGKDYSGLGNNWTPNYFSVTAGAGNDSLVDSPTNYGTDTGVGGEVRGNYATLNPLLPTLTPTNGNLDTPNSSGQNYSTIAVTTGKWYVETTVGPITTGTACGLGVHFNPSAEAGADYYNSGAYIGLLYSNDLSRYEGVNSAVNNSVTASSGSILAIRLDLDSGTQTIAYYLNNTLITSSNLPSGKTWFITTRQNNNQSLNFGQRAFAYTAPSGFKALCTQNLPAPLVTKPSTVMDVKLYTGNGSTQTISGFGFSPDLVWIKARNTSSYNHFLLDTIRGVNKELNSNTTDFEYTRPAPGSLTAFNSDGFDLNTAIGVNASSTTYAAWCWDAGSSTVTNTQGSITGGSQVRANATAGFSIVTYTGNLSSSGTATVGHGLGVAPQMVITKRRNGASDWVVQHVGLPSANNIIYLNSTSATSTSGYGTIVAPTSSVFTTAWITGLNTNGDTHVAYCFAPVVGYSSFGTFVPTGTTDSSFVYCGFRPRLLLVKQTSNSSNWITWDTARDSYNYASKELYPNLSDAEVTNSSTYSLDILSNGFKMRNPGMSAGSTWIYCAWAEAPFNYSRAR